MSADLTDRFAFHRQHPNVSIDAYARQCCIELGVSLAGRKLIYLDKCFWVHLRDVRLSRSQSQSAKDLLGLLTHGVSSRALVCPISDTLFLELLKQTDVRSRRATAELIDELSQGVCLAPNQVRVATEVAHMLHAGAGLAVHALEELVWTKVSHVLGMRHPINSMFAPAEQLVIQKAFFDHRWTHSLAAIVDTIGESMQPKSSMVDLADRLNIENAEHSDGMRSFLHVYRSEIDGVLELAAPIGVDVLHQMAVGASVRTEDATPDQLSALEKQVLGLLRAAVRRPAGRRALRTLHIGATLHAAIRWNKTQKLDANDLYDFHHAEAALGYCDVFLTDGPMCNLLSQKHLGLHEDFPCQVGSSMAAAVKLLS